MRLGKKLFLYLKYKPSKDRIQYSSKLLEASKDKRREVTCKRGIDRPIPYSSLPPAVVSTSINTLALQKWWDIQETHDFSILAKVKQDKPLYKLLHYCSDVWDDLGQQHLDMFGVPENFSLYLAAKIRVTECKLQYAMTNDGTDKMDLIMAEIDLKELAGDDSKESAKKNNLKTKRKIEIALKLSHPIDPNTVTVAQYYTDFELAQEIGSNGN